MNMLFADSAVAVALWLIIKVSALLVLATFAQAVVFRRASAAMRHGIWTCALLSVVLLPIVSVLLPRWPVPVYRTTTPAAIATVAEAIEAPNAEVSNAPMISTAEPPAVPQSAQVSAVAVIAGIYLTGVGILLCSLIIQRASLRRFARRSTLIQDPDWTHVLAECAGVLGLRRPVRLLRSRERNVPMTFGTRQPSIVMPSIADTWDEDRRRAVVLHELAHVVRYDCLTHTIALVACALHWFHPAVWWVARRVRIERELACDDRVIAAGTEPREYAGHLLEIAYSFGGRRAPALAVCMARPRQLEGRMLAALDAARNRRIPSIRVLSTGALVILVVLVLVAAARPVLMADGAPPAPQEWPAAPERPTSPADLVRAKQQLKQVVRLPMRGLQEVRASLRSVAGVVGLTQENLPGTWEIRPSDTKGMVHLRLVELNSSSGTNVPIDQLDGLTASQLTGAGGPVQFRVRRDAGTFTFEGVIRNGVGAGTFSFTPDANFPAELAKRGFARPTPAEQYQLARHDVGFAFVDELTKQGYAKPQTSDLVRAGQHGVQATYLREMAALGYKLGTLDPLITLRDHGVTPDYVRQLADLSYKALDAEEIRRARDHGITPDYVRGMGDAGYGSMPMDELVKVRDHGITPEYVRQLGDAGHRKLPLDQLLKVRDHGVSSEYVREMQKLGYSLPIDELVRARDHGITVEHMREMSALGYSGQPMDAMIRSRDHGVTAEYARDVKALGYDKLSLDDLSTLRDHGLTAERIRSANTRAGTRLPIDLLKSLANGGMR